jgi:uncharacterized membrane protein
MTIGADFIPALLAMAAASFACRAGGFLLMRFVPITARLQAALRAIPFCVMIGIVAPAALRAGPAEWLGLAVIVLAMKLGCNDVLAALLGVATIALARAIPT